MGLGKGMIKILFAPLNYSSVVQTGWYDAFREAGAQLEIFDYHAEYQAYRRKVGRVREYLLNKVKSFKPDLVFLQIQHTNIINGGTIAQIKQILPQAKIVNWTGDVRSYIPRTYKDVGRYSDLNLISSTGQLEMFRKDLNNVKYLQIGYNPKLYYPEENPRRDFTWDCTFIAHYNGKEKYPGTSDRVKAAQALRAKFKDRFCLYGDGWPRNIKSKGSIDQKTVNNIYHQSKCVISVSHFNDISHYFSDRLLMCLASGRPTVQLYFPQYESYFTNNCDLVIADSPEDVATKAEWLVNNPQMANFIGQNGAAKVFAEHTYLSRVKEVFEMVGLK